MVRRYGSFVVVFSCLSKASCVGELSAHGFFGSSLQLPCYPTFFTLLRLFDGRGGTHGSYLSWVGRHSSGVVDNQLSTE